MPKLLGYKKFTSKAGKKCCVATIAFDLTENECLTGSVGIRVDNNVFMPESQVDFLKPEHINHEVILDYNVSAGRAYLNNVTVK